jgi:hypothetical protein
MKAIFLAYNQAHHEDVLAVMEDLQLKGYTFWETVQGEGSHTGQPHLGDHAWPVLDSAMLTVVEDESMIPTLLDHLHDLDLAFPQLGLRAFTWTIESSI